MSEKLISEILIKQSNCDLFIELIILRQSIMLKADVVIKLLSVCYICV